MRKEDLYVCVSAIGRVEGKARPGQQWKERVLDAAADRFERRLAVEISQLRVDGGREFAAVRLELAAFRLSIIRWVAGLLIAHAGVIIGTVFAMMTFLVNALKP